jgi:predicted transcriptional regulator
MKVVHLAVEAELHSQLTEMAKESSSSKAQLVRQALADYVGRREASRLSEKCAGMPREWQVIVSSLLPKPGRGWTNSS